MTDTHEEYTVLAANAGKHVLVEKPMARNVEEARRMVSIENDDFLLQKCYVSNEFRALSKNGGFYNKLIDLSGGRSQGCQGVAQRRLPTPAVPAGRGSVAPDRGWQNREGRVRPDTLQREHGNR